MAATENRKGSVICQRSGERWTAEVRLKRAGDGQGRRYSVALNRTFPTEDAARRAGEQIVADWKEGVVPLRDVLLRELAAAYRALRESHTPMQPATVPVTKAAWERAIASWQELRWIEAPDAARYRDHVQSAFGAEAGPVRRHGPISDAEFGPTG